ncbi:oligoendopeptidase F [bacterium]|nr:oligoendopeptidase F [bacterium]
MHNIELTGIMLFCLVFATVSAFAQEKDRTKIADQYKWDLTHIYPSDDAWKTAKKKLVQDFKKIKAYEGTLNQSSQQLLGCLDLVTELNKTFTRIYVYASMNSDQDTRESKYLGMVQEMSQVGSEFGAITSFVEPEILKMDKKIVDGFIAKEKKLEIYRFYLDDLLRRQAHTGTAGEEKIIADAGLMADASYSIFNIFSNAEFPYPEVTLSDGQKLKLDQANFQIGRTLRNREDRKKVFATFFGKINEFRRTYGTQLYAGVKRNMFFAKARKYDSAMESALDANNIPVSVYQSLVKGVNDNLATFHRYLKLRQRILGLDQLHYYDLYAPLLDNVDLKYSVGEAEQNIIASLAPLGNDYIGVTKKAFSERWIDMYPTEGKRSGAYSNGGAYDVHPYMLMNYNGKYDDMSTLTHELGHTMQSYYSNKTQPYATANYPIFVAEVASTFNEALLIDYMLKQIKDDKVKLSLLGSYLENIKGTVFRQTQFAEFEMKIHEAAEKGEALTGDKFNEIYMELTKRYYGHDKGVCIVDDEMKTEWAYIPHFYYNFYVYQYATSFTASAALSEKVLAGDKEATKKYMEFLAAGGSDYPINLLKKAGVDMTTSQPLELTMKKMNRVMDEMEKILDKMKK